MLRSIQLAGASNTLPSVTLLSLARNPQQWWEDLLIIVARTKMRLVYATVPIVLKTNLRVLGVATISQKIPFRLWSCEQSWQLCEGFFICKGKEGHCIACSLRWIVRTGICVTWDMCWLPTTFSILHLLPCVDQDCDGRRGLGADAWGTTPKEGRKRPASTQDYVDSCNASALAFTDEWVNTFYHEGIGGFKCSVASWPRS